MSKLITHLWYDREAIEAANFYVSLFDNSRIISSSVIKDTPSGDAELVSFQLFGQDFQAISGGPYFKFNPSISIMIMCESVEEVNKLWGSFAEEGEVLMELDQYSFSPWYGWIIDKFGLSWQLMLVDDKKITQRLIPNLLFSSDVCGKAEEAVKSYSEVFKETHINYISKYSEGEAYSPKAKVNYASFSLYGINFSAMDNGFDVDYTFNEAISFMLMCEDQQEIDYYWYKLSAVPEAEACGWCKDKFGVSWQIVPVQLGELMAEGSEEENKRITEAFMNMKKFNIEDLYKAKLG